MLSLQMISMNFDGSSSKSAVALPTMIFFIFDYWRRLWWFEFSPSREGNSRVVVHQPQYLFISSGGSEKRNTPFQMLNSGEFHSILTLSSLSPSSSLRCGHPSRISPTCQCPSSNPQDVYGSVIKLKVDWEGCFSPEPKNDKNFTIQFCSSSTSSRPVEGSSSFTTP